MNHSISKKYLHIAVKMLSADKRISEIVLITHNVRDGTDGLGGIDISNRDPPPHQNPMQTVRYVTNRRNMWGRNSGLRHGNGWCSWLGSGWNEPTNESPNTSRNFCDPIVLTTIPQFLPLLFVVGCEIPLTTPNSALYVIYNALLSMSTYIAIFWHLYHEQNGFYMVMNYILSGALFSMDGALVILTSNDSHMTNVVEILTVYGLNILLAGLHLLSRILVKKRKVNYRMIFSIWNLLYTGKSMYVAYLISCFHRGNAP